MEITDLQEEARKIVDILIQKYRPQKIIMFGSFARDGVNSESDLDLCLIKEDIPVSSADRKFEVYSLLHPRKIPVDVVVYQPSEFEERVSLGDPFFKTILEEGKILYG